MILKTVISSIVCFYCAGAFAQDSTKKKGSAFVIASVGVSKYKELSAKPYASLVAGTPIGQYLAVGVGASLLNIGVDKPYIPLYFQLSTQQQGKKLSPYCGVQVGHGIYHEIDESIETNAGLFVSPFMGIMIPQKKGGAFIIMANYINSAFKTIVSPRGQPKEIKSNMEGFSVGVGFKMG